MIDYYTNVKIIRLIYNRHDNNSRQSDKKVLRKLLIFFI